MPMRSEMIHQIYIADGFDDDCDTLIHRCIRAEKLNYETFCEIWKDMHFDSLYTGRSSVVEIAEMSEELIHIAKQHMVSTATNKFEENVAGLFLVYGLLNLQPYPGFAVLRLVPDDVPQIKRIEATARRERRHDVLYILGTVLVKHTQFHAEQRERGIEQSYKKYLEGFISLDRSGYRPRGVFYRQTEELDLIRELAAVTVRYENAKKAVTGGKKDPSLSFINQSLPGELDSSLKKIISGIPGLVDDDEINEADVHYSRVQAIKEKAMKNTVGSMKHLTSAAERTNEISNPITSEIKSKPGKIKRSSPKKKFSSPRKGDKSNAEEQSPNSSSPKKMPKNTSLRKRTRASTSKLPTKRKITPKRRKTKRNKPDISSSDSDSVSDINLSELEKDSGSDYNVNDSGDELDLNAFHKPTNADNTDKTDEVEIDIDALPSQMTAEDDGRVFEIEIIDELDKTNGTDSDETDEADEKELGRGTVKQIKKIKNTIKPSRKLKQMGFIPKPSFSETRRVTRQTTSSRGSTKK